MSGPAINDATRQQIRAASPRASTWLSANAGSGKTRVLTDRVARLLLRGVPPENVLCLTYTKAAASEMQNRLFKRLGAWSMLDDGDLRVALSELGIGQLDDETLAGARRLFAHAIETPGGLKIQTIHSFCAGLLRRFPLEAGVSPGFTELDDDATAKLRMEVLDRLADEHPDIMADMAALISDQDMTAIAGEISTHRKAFPKTVDLASTLALVGLPADFDPSERLVTLVDSLSAILYIADVLDGQSATMQSLAAELRHAASNGMTPDVFGGLVKRCLYASGENALTPKATALTKKAREALGASADDFDHFAADVADAKQDLMAFEAAQRTFVLHRFAALFLPAYRARKEAGGWLDFDDQIENAEKLLSKQGVADWVLYRLDGSIDHVLVDEAQDTSPLQWRVIDHLTRELTAGEGRVEVGERSIFVVGDLKQSIYSFQGADPQEFTHMRRSFAEKLREIGIPLQELDLEFSFRSAAEILDTVDATFTGERAEGLGGTSTHAAFKTGLPGRVDLWPIVEKTPKAAKGEWFDPVDMKSDEHHTVKLAQHVASSARDIVRNGVLWEQAENSTEFESRAATEGDILILVQSRGPLFHEIIRALKAVKLNVAGADVLKLGEELAVRDILATLSFLATPEDDLSLAAALRSPLFGWSESELYDLAATRPDTNGHRDFLWRTLRDRAETYPETFGTLSDLRDRADFLRPYDLIERLLIRHDGRRRLVARLGEEASDGIDALLTQALAYEQDEPPSLTGFLARMEGPEIKVKRRAEGRGDKIRVMTVHGAKGLESPIVILPDCGNRKAPNEFRGDLLPGADGVPLWAGSRGDSPDSVNAYRTAAIGKRQAESQRLLYVAMTRAEQWLIVAAAGDLGNRGDTWYEQVGAGLDQLGASEHSFFDGDGRRLQSSDWETAKRPVIKRSSEALLDNLPDWTKKTAATPGSTIGTLTPSDLGGEKIVPGEGAGLSEEEAKLRGSRVHLLLEELPHLPRETWLEEAGRLLGESANVNAIDDVLSEVQHVLDNDSLAFLFAEHTLAEVDVTATLPELGDARIHGSIDRLVVRGDSVLAVDFKTNAVVPEHADDTPEGLLRQMGAYASALKQIFPDKTIETAILWTRTAQLMPLNDKVVHEAVSRAAAP